jgi:para-nitrobenzyl esterase
VRLGKSLSARFRVPRFGRFLALSVAIAAQIPDARLEGKAVAHPISRGVEARVAEGILAGRRDGDVVRFLGVPFAAAPVGERRWRPPGPPVAWHGVHDATRFGPACPQPVDPDAGRPIRTSEDCLFLNVWAPANRPHGPLPVLVWIHGGGWTGGTGADPAFDGAAFARDGVIVVSVNYRLGPLGFFAHPGLTQEAGAAAPVANYGLMDNIAALQWVRRNIAAFGGDPARVTVAGESAGAGEVLLLLTVKPAQGLFSQAIVESGPAAGVMSGLADAERAGEAVAGRLGLPKDSSTTSLRAVPVADLLKAARGASPILDGRLVMAPPLSRLLAGEGAPVPLLIGTNADEGSLVPYYGAAADKVVDLLRPWADDLPAVYGADAADPGALKRDLFADLLFAAPARRIAAVQSARAPAYLYRFDGMARDMPGTEHGAPHGAEMVYVFDTLDTRRRPTSDQDQRTVEVVHRCWVGFVATGRPDCGAGAAWPAYRPADDMTMVFGRGRAGGEPCRLRRVAARFHRPARHRRHAPTWQRADLFQMIGGFAELIVRRRLCL